MVADSDDAELYRQAFLATGDPAIITDEVFLIVDVNEACLRMGDWEREDLIGSYPYELFEDPEVFGDVISDIGMDGRWQSDFEARTKDGRQIRGEGTAAPLVIDGEIEGYVAIFVDQTSRRKQEESLRVLNRVLRHNLRNDANVVLGHLETVADGVEDETLLHSLSIATRRVEAILDRAKTTREFSRLLVENDDPAFYPVNVDGAVRQAVNTVDTHGAAVSIETPAGVYILADETVTAALRHVIENAVEHGGEAPTVDITVKEGASRVTICIADDGPGISPDRRDRVLERGGNEVHHGQGLGLFFVDRLMEAYGGEVTIGESERGGCLIELQFPKTTPEKHGIQ